MAGDINDKNKPLIKTGRAFDKIGEFGGRALRDVNFITDLGNFTNDYLNKHNDAAANDLTNFTTSMLVGAVGDAVTIGIVGLLSVTAGPELLILIGLGVGILAGSLYSVAYDINLFGIRSETNSITKGFKWCINETQNTTEKLINNAKDMIHAEDCKLWN